MGAAGGPNIVSSNLQWAIDTTNTKSYPGAGSTAYDLGPNKLNLTGAAFMGSTPYAIASGTTGATATTSILNTDYHSISYTLKIKSTATYPNGYTGNWEKIFSYNAGSTDRSPAIWRYPSLKYMHWQYAPGYNGPNFGQDSGGSEFTIGTTYLITGVKDGGTVIAYINGLPITTVGASNPKSAGTAPIYIFEYYTADLAEISSIYIWDKALSAGEVYQNYLGIKNKYGI